MRGWTRWSRRKRIGGEHNQRARRIELTYILHLSQNACWALLPHCDVNKHRLLPPGSEEQQIKEGWDHEGKNIQRQRRGNPKGKYNNFVFDKPVSHSNLFWNVSLCGCHEMSGRQMRDKLKWKGTFWGVGPPWDNDSLSAALDRPHILVNCCQPVP